MTQSNEQEPAYEKQIQELGEKIRRSIRQDEVHFRRAGDHLDSAFDADAVRRAWQERKDADRKALDRVGMCFARFDLAAGHYLGTRRLPFQSLPEEEQLLAARTILLLTWLITDLNAEKMKPTLSDLQNWPWGIDAEGIYAPVSSGDADDKYNRHLSRITLLGANAPAWLELVSEAWRVHEQDLEEQESLDAKPALQFTPAHDPKREHKYVRIRKSLEKLFRSNNNQPIPYKPLAERFNTTTKTIKRAIADSPALTKIYKDYGLQKAAKETPMTPGLIEATPQSTEVDPAEAAVSKEQSELDRLIAEQAEEIQREDHQAKKAQKS